MAEIPEGEGKKSGPETNSAQAPGVSTKGRVVGIISIVIGLLFLLIRTNDQMMQDFARDFSIAPKFYLILGIVLLINGLAFLRGGKGIF